MTPILLFLVSLGVKASVVLGLAAVVNRLLRGQSAALRHLVWLGAFIGLLLLPIMERATPMATVAIPKFSILAPKRDIATSKAEPLAPKSDDVVPEPVAPPATEASALSDGHGWPVVWALGAALCLLPTAVALGVTRRLRRRGSVATRLSNQEILAARMRVRARWELRSSLTEVPASAMTWGIARPIVLLPKDFSAWPKDRVEAIVLHELAHVRRMDCLSQLLSRFTCALYWFHPAVWLCARAMRAEAEQAADDRVLACGVAPSRYAEELLQFAATLGHRPLPLAQSWGMSLGMPLMKKNKIETRIRSILNHRARRGTTSLQAIVALSVTTLAILPLGWIRPVVQSRPDEDPTLYVTSDERERTEPQPTPIAVPAPAAPSISSRPRLAPLPAPAPSPRASRPKRKVVLIPLAPKPPAVAIALPPAAPGRPPVVVVVRDVRSLQPATRAPQRRTIHPASVGATQTPKTSALDPAAPYVSSIQTSDSEPFATTSRSATEPTYVSVITDDPFQATTSAPNHATSPSVSLSSTNVHVSSPVTTVSVTGRSRATDTATVVTRNVRLAPSTDAKPVGHVSVRSSTSRRTVLVPTVRAQIRRDHPLELSQVKQNALILRIQALRAELATTRQHLRMARANSRTAHSARSRHR